MIRSRRASRVAVLGLLLAFAGPVAHADARRDARVRFLRDGDAGALARGLEAAGAADAGARTHLELARLAADAQRPLQDGGLQGIEAVVDAVRAFRRQDLQGAEAAAARAGADIPLAAYCLALLRARRGDDGEAGEALERAVDRRPDDPEVEAFEVALLGAALPALDRMLLARLGELGVTRTARLGRYDLVWRLGGLLPFLDRERGLLATTAAVRALRRAGRADEAARLVTAFDNARRSSDPAALRIEHALGAWLANRPAEARALLQDFQAPPEDQVIVQALARAGPCGPLVGTSSRVVGIGPDEVDAHALARLATECGVTTRAEEVEARAVGRSRKASDAGFPRDFLESRGLAVQVLAGDPAAAEAALAEGLPVLVYRIVPRQDAFAETPVLVRGRDEQTGLWVVDEPDLSRRGVLAPGALLKARVVLAAPPAKRALLDRYENSLASRLGRALEAALDAAARGQTAEGVEALVAREATFQGIAPFDLYLGLLHHRRFLETQDPEHVHLAAAALDRSAETQPTLPFEHFARAQSRFLQHQVDEALASFDEAERVGGPAPYISRARFAVLLKIGGRGEQALAEVERAYALDPMDAETLYYLGSMLARRGDVANARQALGRAMDRRPGASGVALELVSLELGERRPEQALAILDALVRQDPQLAGDEAVRAARRAVEGLLLQDARGLDGISRFLTSPEPESRRRVAFSLAALEVPEAEARLRTLLDDAEAAVRVTTLRVYMRPWLRARVESDELLGRRVVEMLQKDPAPVVRGAAAGLLGLLSASYADAALAAALAGPARDPDPYPRSAVASALARRDGPLGRRALVEALADEQVAVRRTAIESLFKLASSYHGFDPEAPPAERTAAIARWRAWLEEGDE